MQFNDAVMSSLKSTEVASPCVRNCCLNESDICLGCFRHIDEIVGWQSFSLEKKQGIIGRCQVRKAEKESK